MLYAIVAVIILIIDQASKYWISTSLAVDASAPFLPGFIQLTNVQNSGAAFGIFSNGRWIFVILTLVVAIFAVVLLSRNIIKGKLGRWMLVLVIAGGLGNCIDRLVNGYVVDMFQFQFMNFAIFNVADIFITVGGIVFCLYLIFHKDPETELVPEPVRAPAHTERAAEKPARNADYITQLKRPVVEGRRNIEAEFAAKTVEASPFRSEESTITDWNMPEFEKAAAAAKPAPEAQPEIKETPKPEALDELFKEPAKPAKKSDSDFSLEDILAEFKD